MVFLAAMGDEVTVGTDADFCTGCPVLVVALGIGGGVGV